MYNANYLDFEPRFGFAYQLTHKTVIRAGFGIFYDFTSESVNSLGNNNAPFAGNLAITNQRDSDQPGHRHHAAVSRIPALSADRKLPDRGDRA